MIIKLKPQTIANFNLIIWKTSDHFLDAFHLRSRWMQATVSVRICFGCKHLSINLLCVQMRILYGWQCDVQCLYSHSKEFYVTTDSDENESKSFVEMGALK